MRTAALATTALATVTLTVSCNRAPTTPTPQLRDPAVIRVELIAPGSLAPGASAQLRLLAHRSNGTVQDVTPIARFSSDSSGVLDVSPDGRVTGLKLGEGFVSGNDDRFSNARQIVVVPDGTFRVVGQVFEEANQGLAVGGVRVDADGVQAVFTDLSGRYRLYGVAANARMRATKPGYVTKEQTLSISDHHTENVFLSLAGSRLDVAGVYQLTIEAGAECRGPIPDPLLIRRYPAAVTQSGAEIQVVVSGSRFFPGFAGPSDVTVIPGRVEQGDVYLDLASPTHCERSEPDSRLVEIIDDKTYLDISGGGRLTRVSQGFSGALPGYFAVYADPGCGSSSTRSVCTASSHRITLTR